jgi:Tol biopolymer transport system component
MMRLIFAALLALTIASMSHAAPGDTQLISARDPQITLATASGQSANAAVSADGRFIAFESVAGNLIPGDTNGRTDVFVYDRSNGAIERVSVSSGAEQGNSDSVEPSISADGRFVAFSSNASNLVAGDSNAGYDVFVRDRLTQATFRISVSSSGAEAVSTADPNTPVASGSPAISGDGRFVAFSSNAENFVSGVTALASHIYVRDILAGTTAAVSVDGNGALANDISMNPAISADGRFVAFSSLASNLDANDTSQSLDIFVRDLSVGATQRISTASEFSDHASLSSDGRFVAFQSASDVAVYDRQAGVMETINAQSEDPSISADGRFVLFTSEQANVYVRDRQTGANTLVSEGGNAASSRGALSGDGQVVVFQSVATNFVTGDQNDDPDIFVRTLAAPALTLVSAAKLPSQTAPGASETSHDRALSSNGRLVAFKSEASILANGDANQTSDVFVRDTQAGTTTLVTRSSNGTQADSGSFDPAISGNGRFVAYQSFATNLISNDANSDFDIFVHNRDGQTTSLASVSSNGVQANASSANPSTSSDGQATAFVSTANNLVQGDPDAFTPDVFVRNATPANTARVDNVELGGLEPSISTDGRYVAFVESSQVYVLDRRNGARSLVSVGVGGAPPNAFSGVPSISADGRYVAFYSGATNLVPGDEQDALTGVYVRDRIANVTTRVSESSVGASANADCFEPAISGNGRYIAFYSGASNLVADDTNNASDVFVYDRMTGATTRESVDSNGGQSDGESFLPSLSQDGLKIAFTSKGSNLVPNDFNGDSDVFVHEHRSVPVVRIDAGGPGAWDSKGHFWQSDRGFRGGSVSVFPRPIANTTDDLLYQTERWDQTAAPEMQYNISVPSGTYWVRLHFAENFPPNFAVGRRVFAVDMEGVRVFDNVDVFKEAGARTALVKSAAVNVTDGQLNIQFLHQVQNPIVDAIEVIGQ